MTVSRRLRFEILRRDGHACRYCGATAPDVALTVDHVIPTTLGGGDEPANLVTACQPCNAGKSSVPADAAIVEDVDATAMLFAHALEFVTERRRADRAAMVGIVDRLYQEWTAFVGGWLPPDWDLTFERWIAGGLDEHEVVGFIRRTGAAARGNYWKYLCGCCWGELRERTEDARRAIEDGEV